MSSLLLHIADRVLNRPLLVTPDKAQVVLQVLAGRIGVNAPGANRFEGSDFVEEEPGKFRERPYRVAGGVGIITITGSLVNRGAWVGVNSGKTSYEGIQHQVKTAMADAAVRSVILDLHSPGGEAVGAFETGAMVRLLAASKRTVAVVNGMAASAAYAIASGATEIVTTETGVAGSIGVVLLHADFSRNLANEGITPTLIFAGAHKVDGNPFEPLSDAVREDLQAEVNAFYDQFLKTVALGRGARLTADMARATEARTLIGEAALAAGLADRIGTFESVLAELQGSSSRAPAPGRSTSMKGKTMDNPTGEPAADAGNITKADLDKAVAEAVVKGLEDGRKAEAARIAGIEANLVPGCEALIAAHKADPTMTPEKSAIAVLAAIKAKPQDVRAGLEALDKAAAGVVSTPSTTGTGGEQPKATTPDGWKAEYEASDKLKAEYPTVESYVATKKREAARAA